MYGLFDDKNPATTCSGSALWRSMTPKVSKRNEYEGKARNRTSVNGDETKQSNKGCCKIINLSMPAESNPQVHSYTSKSHQIRKRSSTKGLAGISTVGY